jgi:O-antigen/teichoic acid export membrane protein
MTVGRNIVWSLFEQFSRVGVAFFVNLLIARSLGPIDYGEFASAMAVAAVLSAMVLLGLDIPIMREIGAAQQVGGPIVGGAIALRLATSLVLLICVLVWYVTLKGAEPRSLFRELLLIICLLLPFQALGSTISNCLMALWQSRYGVYSLLISLFLATSARIVGIQHGAGATYFAWCYLFEYAFATVLISWYFIKFSLPLLGRIRFDLGSTLALCSGAGWLFGSSILTIIIQHIGLFLLNLYGNTENTGHFAGAIRIVAVLQILPTLITQSFIPVISRLHDLNDPSVAELEKQLFRLLWLIGYTGSLFLWVLSPMIVDTLLGVNFKGSAPMLQVLAFSIIPFSVGAARAAVFSKGRNYSRILITDVANGLSTITLSIFLSRHYGGVGIAAAGAIGAFLGFVVCPLFLQTRSTTYRRSILVGAIFPFPNLKTLFYARS